MLRDARLEEHVFNSLQWLSGKTQRRSIGIAVIEANWENEKLSHLRATWTSVLVAQAVYLLAEQEREEGKQRQHEITNLNNILRILKKATETKLLDDRHVTELQRALKAGKDNSMHGLELPEEVETQWQKLFKNAKSKPKNWTKLLQKLSENQKVFLALVAHHTPGSPGTTGAKLWISETGETCGTIGGGIMEQKLIDRAQEILKQEAFKPEIQTLYHRTSGSGDKSGMICSGSQTNLYYLCHPSRDRETVEKVVSLIEQNISGSLSIDVSGMSVVEKAVNLAQPAIQLIQESGSWKYEEQLLNRQRIAIIGGGHCSLALSRVMSQLDYEVLVFDTRREVSTLTQNTYARSIKIVADYQEVGALIPFPQVTCVVVMTTDFHSDIRALLGVASLPFPFIGVMGSHAKIAKIFEQLQQSGISENALARIYAPVGLPINSHTPEEIAISIAAQILQERNQWQP